MRVDMTLIVCCRCTVNCKRSVTRAVVSFYSPSPSLSHPQIHPFTHPPSLAPTSSTSSLPLPLTQVADVVTLVRSVNKSDVGTLGATFGTYVCVCVCVCVCVYVY